MSLTLIHSSASTDTESLLERLINRLFPPVPLTDLEIETLQAQKEAAECVKKAAAENAKLFAASTAVKRAMVAEIEARTARANAEAAAAKKADDEPTYQFCVKQMFSHNKVDGHMLIVTFGESKSGKRKILSYRGRTPNGGHMNISENTETWFKTTRVYTQVVLPWMHGTITTDQVRSWKPVMSADKKNMSAWVEFPLGE